MHLQTTPRVLGILASVSIMALGLAGTNAKAETAAPAGEGADATQPAADLNEIIVTARKVAERLQDVPVAITAFSGAALTQQNATRISDVSSFTPGLVTAQGSNNPTVLVFSIRGQVQTDDLATLEPSVGTYIDGIYVARSYGINADLVDVSNVQVLKGPQGTLFGRNTSAGAMLVQTNNPNTHDLAAEANLTYGRFNQIGGGAVFNLPIVTDKLAVRGAFQVNSRDGYITDIDSGKKYDNYDTFTGRVKALWTPVSNVSILGSAEWYTYSSNGPARFMAYGGPNYLAPLAGVEGSGITQASAAPIPSYAGAVDAGYLVPAGINPPPHNFAYYQNLASTNPNAIAVDTAPYTSTKTQTYSLTASVEESYGTFKLIGGYRRVEAYANVDLDGTPYEILSTLGIQALHQWSIEGQLTGKVLDRKLDYAVGATYFTEAGGDLSYSSTLIPSVGYGYYEGDINNKSFGIYAQGSYHFTDKLSFTAGLRWSSDKKFVMTHNSAISAYGAGAEVLACDLMQATNLEGAAPGANCSLGHGDTFSALSYTFGLDYKLTPSILLYAKASKGYRSGGENLRANGDAATFAPFQPEINYEEEIGFKGDFLDHKVRFNIAAYYNDIHDAQRTQLLAVTSGPLAGALLTSLGNADLARNMGFEADLVVRVTSDFSLQATGNINDSKYLNYTAPAAFGSPVLTDHRSEYFVMDPKGSFTVAGNYKHTFGGVTVSGRVDYSWVASYYDAPDSYGSYPVFAQSVGGVAIPASPGLPSPAAEIAAFTTPATGILGARIGFGMRDDTINLAFWGKNLTNNRDYSSGVNVAPFGLVSSVRRDPVSYGVSLSVKY